MTKSSFSIEGAAGKTIDIDFTPSAASSCMVIFVHGFKGFKDWGTHDVTAKYFARRGLGFLKFNFSHNGISRAETDRFDDLEAFGENTFSKELYDLDQVISFTMSGSEFATPEYLFLIGHSRGGGISIIKTAEDPRITRLVTWASISNFRNLWPVEKEGEWRKNGVIHVKNARTNQEMPLNIGLLRDLEENVQRLDISSAASRIERPWLILHGTDDQSVAIAEAAQLAAQKTEAEFLEIAGADHVFNARHPWPEPTLPKKLQEVCDATIAFFKEQKFTVN
ncbi:S9 family peptidase [Pedobacter sp. SYSU D00535]|uniref:alpha/beta hydrolase family protein n=1 Tax=Pedobacter sp. SYSU D00535 TaxID=2810308 RepID=UPI001A96D989|nr:alpha/beta hydrolase [Pedobacter sp. SYSU D00535]